tara:strand:+ start:1606 stop:1785 length:180 start_codon:yes stop_codon:yes gene_type:complete
MGKREVFNVLPESIIENDSLDNILKAFLIARKDIINAKSRRQAKSVIVLGEGKVVEKCI